MIRQLSITIMALTGARCLLGCSADVFTQDPIEDAAPGSDSPDRDTSDGKGLDSSSDTNNADAAVADTSPEMDAYHLDCSTPIGTLPGKGFCNVDAGEVYCVRPNSDPCTSPSGCSAYTAVGCSFKGECGGLDCCYKSAVPITTCSTKLSAPFAGTACGTGCAATVCRTSADCGGGTCYSTIFSDTFNYLSFGICQ